MKFYRILPLTFMALLATASQAQTMVNDYRPGITTDGITYFLPQTAVRIVVTATRTTHHPGSLCAYAERHFSVSDAPQTTYDEWKIDDIQFVPYGVPDKNHVYTIALNPKSSAPLVTLAPDGRLLAVNTECDLPKELPAPKTTPLTKEQYTPTDFFSQDIQRAATESKRAELIAQEIFDIRENRTELAKGQADFNPENNEQLSTMFAELSREEKALYSLYVGTTSTEQQIFVYDYTPSVDVTDQLVFRFSRHLGMVDADDLAGEPYYLSVRNVTMLPDPTLDPKAAKKKELPDLRYRIPGRANLSLRNAENEVASAIIPVAQMGNIEHLGGDLFNKKYTTRILVNPVTGGLDKIDMDAPVK